LTLAEYELRFINAGIDQLESYLLSNDIYRPIGVQPPSGGPPYPQLTLGWLLLFRLKAQAICQSGDQRAELELLNSKLGAIRAHWRSAWNNKSKAEFQARLNLWRDFLEEYRRLPGQNFDRYAFEVNRRAMLDLLLLEIEKLPHADKDSLEGLDKLLNTAFIPGEFIWDERFVPSFPRPNFWYLYGSLKRD
jgi:hypothetical protein